MAEARILIAEDDQITARHVQRRLQGAGYEVVALAASGQAAIEKTSETRPDLVLMDIGLKGQMDGIEAARQIRSQFNIPVVFLTAHSDTGTLRRAEITEPYGYILKPFQERDLRVTVEMALHSHRLKRELRESEARYRDLFENSPVSLWEEDFSAVITYLDSLRQQGLADFRRYFDDHPDEVARCAAMVKVNNVNRVALQLHGFESKEDPRRDFLQVLGIGTVDSFKEELVAAAQGQHSFERETVNYTPKGDILHVQVRWATVPGYEDDLSRVIVSVIDLTERKHAEEAAQRKVRDQELLLETARYLTTSLDVTEVLTRIDSGAREILDAVGCATYLLENDGKTLTPVVVLDPEHEEAVRSSSLNVETSFTGQAVKAKRGLIFNDAGSDFSGYQIPGTPVEEEERIIAAPFLIDDEVIGAMCLNRIGRDFSQEDLMLAESFAAFASSALKNAQAHRRVQHEVEERRRAEEERERLLRTEREQRVLAEALRRAVAALNSTLDYEQVLDLILEQVALVLPCDAADVMLIEEDQGRVFRRRGYEQLGGGEFMASWSFQVDDIANLRRMRDTRQPLAIPDVAGYEEWVPTPETGWIASYIGAPICLRDRVIGFLNVNNKTPNFYCQADAEQLQAFADHAAVAMRNARLYDQAQKELAERKRAEEQIQASLREKEVLLQEIHHRVKNNLNVISSLLDLQSDTIEDPAALQVFADSRRRIRSMALIHEKLYRSPDLASIDASEYVQEVADYLAGAYEGRGQPVALKVQVEDVPLDIDTAIPCGLIINELVANALEHAFPPDGDRPAGGEGVLRVELRSDDGQMVLMVADNGVGLPPDVDYRNTDSLGLQLVNLLTAQLGGTIELDRAGGTAFTITFAQKT